MPLADLVDGNHYAARFVDVTAAPSELLVIEGRIATLSDRGIYVLQQRLVKHYTRLEVDIPALAKEAAPVLWEMHQQRDWVETVLDEEADWTSEKLSAEESAFDAWLRAGEPSRRECLKLDHTHTDLRKRRISRPWLDGLRSPIRHEPTGRCGANKPATQRLQL